MAFAFDANTNTTVRSLCLNSSPAYVPDAILNLDYYKTTILNRVLAYLVILEVDYDALDPDEQDPYRNAAHELLAARVCRFHLRHRPWMESNNKSIAQAQKVDWDAIANQLEQSALDVLDPTGEVSSSFGKGLRLAPTKYNPVTGVEQSVV